MPQITRMMGNDPTQLRRYLQEGSDEHLWLRRGTIVVSLIGIAAVAATTLLRVRSARLAPLPGRRAPLRRRHADLPRTERGRPAAPRGPHRGLAFPCMTPFPTYG